MGIDVFTLIAQLVNFVVLLVLLRAFLYRPIMRVMREREQRIADEHAAAKEAGEEAEARAEELRREREELEATRRERLAEIEREAEELREERLAEAREEAEAARERWREALARERDELADAVRGKAAAVLADALRRGWRELADEELEARAIEVFARRLDGLEDGQRSALAGAARGGELLFTTAFEATDERRESLLAAVRSLLGEDHGETLEADFERDPELIAGVTLRAGDLRVGWTARAQLDDLERGWAGIGEEG
ncbi:MAG: F0F1 ATP synthase subunit delta [Trueperaceae bacterium]|nr:F0F1 ATP synthase subunit delta [Trueperaceae bacterium]